MSENVSQNFATLQKKRGFATYFDLFAIKGKTKAIKKIKKIQKKRKKTASLYFF